MSQDALHDGFHEHHDGDGHQGHHHNHASAQHDPARTEKDPVCGMSVAPNDERCIEHDGHKYYFCSIGCKTKFAAHPDQYLKPKAAPAASAATDVIYTCPMHPQIRQVGPGKCPICGMALEPENAGIVEDRQRAARYDAAVLGQRAADRAAGPDGHDGICTRLA